MNSSECLASGVREGEISQGWKDSPEKSLRTVVNRSPNQRQKSHIKEPQNVAHLFGFSENTLLHF